MNIITPEGIQIGDLVTLKPEHLKNDRQFEFWIQISPFIVRDITTDEDEDYFIYPEGFIHENCFSHTLELVTKEKIDLVPINKLINDLNELI